MNFDALSYFDEAIGNYIGPIYVLMRGYFDESGTHDPSRVTTLAGYLATREQWKTMLGLWQNALEVDAEGLPVFHATEFDHWAIERGWTATKKQRVIEKLASIPTEHAILGVSGSVIVSGYDTLSPWVREKIGGRYHFTFAVAMHALRQQVEWTFSKEPITLTFDRKNGVIGRVIDDYNDILETDYRNQFGSLWFDSKDRCPALQIADLLVYEINRFLEDSLLDDKPARPAIKQFAKKRRVHIRYHDEETLALLPAMLEQDRAKLEAGKDTLDIWWPPSWHRHYQRPKKQRISYLGQSPDLSKRR
jgi:hypothetical protein